MVRGFLVELALSTSVSESRAVASLSVVSRNGPIAASPAYTRSQMSLLFVGFDVVWHGVEQSGSLRY